VDRVGGQRPIPVDFRLVVATNRNLEEMVRAGKFRDDLHDRLNMDSIRLPPLRERLEDIPLSTSSVVMLSKPNGRGMVCRTRSWTCFSSTGGRVTSGSWRTSSAGPASKAEPN